MEMKGKYKVITCNIAYLEIELNRHAENYKIINIQVYEKGKDMYNKSIIEYNIILEHI